MLKFVGRICRRFGGQPSLESELRLQPHLRGIIVKSLPKDISCDELTQTLQAQFNSQSVDLRTDVQGNAGYAIIKFDDESDMNKALELHKTEISGKKIYLCVFSI